MRVIDESKGFAGGKSLSREKTLRTCEGGRTRDGRGGEIGYDGAFRVVSDKLVWGVPGRGNMVREGLFDFQSTDVAVGNRGFHGGCRV